MPSVLLADCYDTIGPERAKLIRAGAQALSPNPPKPADFGVQVRLRGSSWQSARMAGGLWQPEGESTEQVPPPPPGPLGLLPVHSEDPQRQAAAAAGQVPPRSLPSPRCRPRRAAARRPAVHGSGAGGPAGCNPGPCHARSQSASARRGAGRRSPLGPRQRALTEWQGRTNQTGGPRRRPRPSAAGQAPSDAASATNHRPAQRGPSPAQADFTAGGGCHSGTECVASY